MTAVIALAAECGNTLPGILPLFPLFGLTALMIVGAKNETEAFRETCVASAKTLPAYLAFVTTCYLGIAVFSGSSLRRPGYLRMDDLCLDGRSAQCRRFCLDQTRIVHSLDGHEQARNQRQNTSGSLGATSFGGFSTIAVNPAGYVSVPERRGCYLCTAIACGSRCRPRMLRIKRAITCAVASPTSRAG